MTTNRHFKQYRYKEMIDLRVDVHTGRFELTLGQGIADQVCTEVATLAQVLKPGGTVKLAFQHLGEDQVQVDVTYQGALHGDEAPS